MRILLSLGLLFIMMLGTACTEDRVQQTVLKPEDQIFAKSKIDQDAHYLYVPLGQESSRTSLYGRAFEVGQTKVVKVQVNEFSMDVVSIEKDERFNNNPNNQKVLLSIPIDHVDYRCLDDAYGECIGQEVENDRINWDQKNYIRPNFANAKIIDTNFFAYEFAGPRSCYEEQNTEVLARNMTDNSINFTLKRDYKDQLFFFCIRNHDLSDFTNLNWTETTSYSLVKLDDVASKDYKKSVYHPDWINTFGFFETDDYKLDVDGNAVQSGETKYMQMWNPNREEIVYHLSESFNKPENAVLKAATYESFKRLNAGLAKAGVKFRLRLSEPNPEISAGDLRNSMIILVDDPAASSVIGYGPSIANPLTGEVVAARTVMYSGSIRKFVRFTYDDIVREHKKSLVATSETSENKPPTPSNNLETLSAEELHLAEHLTQKDAAAMLNLSNIGNIEPIKLVDRAPQISEQELKDFMSTEAKRDFIAIMAEQNKYPAEALEFGDISQDLIVEMVTKLGELKPWEQLSDIQKQKALDVLIPYVWVPTLVHEVGHNLGLRHNFSGSEDEANFYSQDELKALNVPVSTDNVPFSSVMDYPKSEVNALRTLGKYDIAALKFGYTKSVALEDGTVKKINTAVPPTEEPLKAYQYCSDEGVAPNPTCNPFDEGIGMVEIAQSFIDSYKDRYDSSNFRKGRANFSGMSDDFYLRRINRTFGNLRLIYERYESLVKEFQIDQETINSVPWLKDIDDAVVLAADFMMEVIGTPDTLCIVQDTQTQQLQPAPIGIFSSLAHDRTRECSKLQLNERFVVVGQGGKALNSSKAPTNPNRFADQIDVRGIWMDKALAMNSLFRRTMGSTLHDKFNGNFLDHPRAGAKVFQFLNAIMTNQVVTPVDIEFVDGSKQTVNLQTDFDADYYEIPTPELPLPSMMLGIPYKNLHLPEVLVMKLMDGIYQGADSESKEFIQSQVKVFRNHPEPGSKDYVQTTYNGQTIYAHKESSLAANLVVTAERSQFYESTGIPVEQLTAMLEEMQKPKPTPAPTPVEGPKQEEESAPQAENRIVEVASVNLSEVLAKSAHKDLTPEELVKQVGPEALKAYLDNPVSSTYTKRVLSRLYKF